MTNNDHEHLAFEAHCEEANLDNRQHPLHLLYLEGDTQRALTHFKAGYAAGKEQAGNKSDSVTGYAQTDGERIKELEKWIVDCRDKILYPLAHEDTEIGRLAEGFGASTAKLLSA